MMELSIQRRPGKRPCSPTLVLLHGWGYHKNAWPESWLQNLLEHYDLLLVDLPGHGDDSCHVLEDRDLSVLDIWLQSLGASLPAQCPTRNPRRTYRLALRVVWCPLNRGRKDRWSSEIFPLPNHPKEPDGGLPPEGLTRLSRSFHPSRSQ